MPVGNEQLRQGSETTEQESRSGDNHGWKVENFSKAVRRGAMGILKFAVKAPIRFVSFVLIGIIIISLIFEAGEDKTIIGNFSIPKSLVDRGYTPVVFSRLIYDQIEKAKNEAAINLRTIEEGLPVFRDSLSIPKPNERAIRIIAKERSGTALDLLMDSDDESGIQTLGTQDFNITVPGTGISINDLIPWLRKRLGLTDNTKEITGEIICEVSSCDSGGLSINIRYKGFTEDIPTGNVPAAADMPVLIKETAGHILSWQYPKAKALSNYFGTPEERKTAVEELKTSIDRMPEDEDYKIYSLLGIVFTYEREYRFADDHFILASQINDLSSYNNLIWIHSLIYLEKSELAKNKFASVISDLGVDQNMANIYWKQLTAVKGRKGEEAGILRKLSLPAQALGDARDFYEAGISLYVEFYYELAIEQFQKAVKLNPGEKDFWTALGDAFYVMGSVKQAVAAYLEVNALDPNDLYTLIAIGDSYLELFRNDKAIEYYNKALSIDPIDSYTYSALGYVYFRSGLYFEAIESYQKTIHLNPGNGFDYLNLAEVYAAQLDFEKALKYYQRAEKLGVNYSYFYESWGDLLEMSGDKSGASEKYEKSKELFVKELDSAA